MKDALTFSVTSGDNVTVADAIDIERYVLKAKSIRTHRPSPN